MQNVYKAVWNSSEVHTVKSLLWAVLCKRNSCLLYVLALHFLYFYVHAAQECQQQENHEMLHPNEYVHFADIGNICSETAVLQHNMCFGRFWF